MRELICVLECANLFQLAEERIKREIEESNKAGGTGTTLTDVLEQKYYDHHALESIVKAKADEVTKVMMKTREECELRLNSVFLFHCFG